MWPRCDDLVVAAASGQLAAVRRLLDADVPVIATNGNLSTALHAASDLSDLDPDEQPSDETLGRDRLAVAKELLERGFPICFGGGGPSLLLSAMIGCNAASVSLLLTYGDGREFEGEIGKHLLGNARGPASGTGLFALNMMTPAARLVMTAATTCHPGKVRRAIRRLRRLALIVGRLCIFIRALYNEVHYRPGGEGEKAAKASFQASLH